MTAAVEAARALVGARFRLQGRGRDGVDCVGVAAAALRAAGYAGAVPDDYALRGGADVVARLDAVLMRVAAALPGDVMLFRVGAGQLHLGVATDIGVVHADAGLGRVVERPGVMPWPVVGVWRVATPSGP